MVIARKKKPLTMRISLLRVLCGEECIAASGQSLECNEGMEVLSPKIDPVDEE